MNGMEQNFKICFYSCSYQDCNATFYRKDRYESHLKVHTGERPFICMFDGCDKSYTRASHLKRHETIHSQGEFRCEIEDCKTIFKTPATLKKHMDYVHNKKKVKKYECPHCQKVFNKHNWLKIHVYRHTNVKPYECPEEGCGMRFCVPNKLRRHLKVHQGYKCDRVECNEVLANWSLLQKHIKLSHPQEYRCEICRKTFSTSFNLGQHEQTHDKNRLMYCCPIRHCSRLYSSEKNLRVHLKRYHDKRPFACTEAGCCKFFKDEVDFRKHKRFHDPSKPLPSKDFLLFHARRHGESTSWFYSQGKCDQVLLYD